MTVRDPTLLLVGERLAAALGGGPDDAGEGAGPGPDGEVPGEAGPGIAGGDLPPLSGTLDVETATPGDLPDCLDGVDCAVCDGDDDGLTALRRLRKGRPGLPAILYTDEPDGRLAAAATRQGVDEYVAGTDLAEEGETLAERVGAVLARRNGAGSGTTGGADGDGGATTDDDRGAVGDDRATADDRFDRLLGRIDEGYVAIDEDGRIVRANDRARELLGLAGSVAGTSLAEALPPCEADQGVRARLEGALGAGDRVSFEAYHAPRESWLDVAVHPDGDGATVLVRDVTEQRRREGVLGGLLTFTRSLMAAGDPDAIADLAVEAAEEVLGFEVVVVRRHDPEAGTLPAVAVGDRAGELLEDVPTYGEDEGDVGRVFRTGEPEVFDDVRHRSDVDYGPVRAAITLPLGDHGVMGIGSTALAVFDESDLRAAELLATAVGAALDRADRIQQLAEYETIVETAREMLYVLDESDRFTLVTERLANTLGYDRAELVGEHVSTVLDAEEQARRQLVVRDLIASGGDPRVFRTSAVTADGDYLPVEVEVTLLPDGDGEFHGTVGAVRDISDLRAAERRLATQTERFEYLLEHTPDPVVEVEFVEDDPVVRSVNPAFETTFGYDSEAAAGRPLNELIVPEEERDGARRLDERAGGGEAVTAEVRRETVDGVRTFLLRAVTYRLRDGRRFGVGVYTDVTEQEERHRRLQVLQTVLRHNVRNDATVIRGYAERLGDRGDDDLVAAIRDRTDRLVRMSDKARDIEHALAEDPWDPEVRDVVPMVESAVRSAREDHPGATVETDLPGSARAVADGRVERVLSHLLENAVVHCDRPPEITVSVGVDPDRDDRLAVRVADNGPGIPERERELIAGDREITQLDHGSGLGLWVTAWVARALGGEVDFEDADPRGSVVVLRLPREHDS